MTRVAALGLLYCVAAGSAAAQALPELRFEAGYARVQQPLDTAPLSSDALIASVFWRRPAETWTFLASGNLTYGRDSIAAAQGVAAIAVPWRIDERLRTEAGVAAAAFSLRATGRGGNTNFFVRQHFVAERGGLWVGGGAARTARPARSGGASVVNTGAWSRWRFLYGSLSASRIESDDFALLVASGAGTDPAASQYILDDLEFVLEARGGPHSLAVSWTSRAGRTGTDTDVIAISSSGILQLSDRLAFTASAGRQLADPLRGLPQGEIYTAALRVSLGPRPLPVMQRSAIARASVETRPGGGGVLEVRVFAADTMLIEVAGDFSDWHPLPLEREGSFWVARVRLGPGKYRVAVRSNLGPWRAPRNLARVRDDYGGEAGLLVIP